MILKTLFKSIKPFQLISLVATYLLGAGLVQYVREIHSWNNLIEGLLFLILIYLSVVLLTNLQRLTDMKNWPEGSTLIEIKQTRWGIALVLATILTTSTTILIGWMQRGVLWQGFFFLISALLLIAGFYYLVLIVNAYSISQLVLEVMLFVVIPPALSFFIQSRIPHPLLTQVVICLVPAYLAYRVLEQLKRFGSDQVREKKTLVTQIGWDKAMVFHNALILLTYLLFALISIFGFPWFLLWPVFLTLPIGLLEVWLMERTRRGGKPLWRIMQFASVMVFFFPIYLIAFAFWIR